MKIMAGIYLRIMDIVRESGTGFAFPSHTMYVRRDGPLDDEKRRTAEAQVRVWRGEGELGLPEFSEQRIAALARTLEYPPEGAASRQAAR
jgi:MscS family membrane protein